MHGAFIGPLSSSFRTNSVPLCRNVVGDLRVGRKVGPWDNDPLGLVLFKDVFLAIERFVLSSFCFIPNSH